MKIEKIGLRERIGELFKAAMIIPLKLTRQLKAINVSTGEEEDIPWIEAIDYIIVHILNAVSDYRYIIESKRDLEILRLMDGRR